MTMFAVIKQSCRDLLGDTISGKYVFTDQQIEDWINQAIRDLSQKFPRETVYTIETLANVRVYDLETDVLSVLSAEYPTDQDPKVFLTRRAYTDPGFWIKEGLYDFFKPSDGDSLNPPKIYLSTKPPAGETITLHLLVEHRPLMDPTDETTLQDRHLNLIGLFVRWKAWQELSMNEGMYPSALITTNLAYNAETSAARAESSYRNALDEALKAETSSAASPWRMDKFDGGY